jgi:hypothetical protein
MTANSNNTDTSNLSYTAKLRELEAQHVALFAKLYDEVKERSIADFIVYDKLAREIAIYKALEGYSKGYSDCYREMQEKADRDLA